MINIGVASSWNRETNQMPEAVNTSGRRKVRCPKCTARLTEPPTLIYQCPVCSTLLLAKGNSDECNDKSSENKLRGDGRDTDINQQSPERGSKVGKASVTKESIQTQGHSGMEYMENENLSTKERNWPLSRLDSPDETINNDVFNHMQEDVQLSTLEEQPLHRKKYRRPKLMQTDAFVPKVDSLASELPPYTLRWRSSEQSSVKSCESSDRSVQGKFSSDLKSPSYYGSETEDDFPAYSSENSHVAELPETTPSISQIKGSLDNSGKSEENELEDDHDEFANRGDALQETSGQVVELCFLGGSGNEGSVMTRAGELDYDTDSIDGLEVHGRDKTIVDLGNKPSDSRSSEVSDSRLNDRLHCSLTASRPRNDSDFGLFLSDQNSAEVAASSYTDKSQDCLTESCVQNETVVDSRNTLPGLPLQVADCKSLDELQSKGSGSRGWTVSLGNCKGTNSEQSCSNNMILEPSECRRQQLLDDCARNSVVVDDDGIGDDRNQWSKGRLSTLPQQVRDSKMETNCGYTDLLTERLVNSGASDSSEMPLCDRESVQLSNFNRSSKENCSEADLVDEKRVVDLSISVVAGLSLKDEKDTTFPTSEEDTRLNASFPNQKEVSVVQNQALFGMNKSDPSSAIFIAGAHVEKPSVMHKNFQRTKEERTDHMQFYNSVIKLEANIGNPPCVEEFQPQNLSTTDKIDRSDLAMVVSEKCGVDVSNLDLIPRSSIEHIDRKTAPSSWSEKPVGARHAFREDGHFRKESTLEASQCGNGAVEQETALADQCTVPDISAGNVFVPGNWPRSYHYLKEAFVSPERMQMNDNEGKVSAISRRQKPTSGHCVDTNMGDFNLSRQGLYGQQGKYVNPEFGVQTLSLHGNLQEHGTHLQTPKFQSEKNTMVQSSHCLFCVPANTFHGHSAGSEKGIPHFHPNEQYLSDIRGLSLSTASNRAYPFQVSSQGAMLPAMVSGHVFSQCPHHSIPPVCNFCMQQPQMGQQFLPEPMQHDCAACFSKATSAMTHQPALHEGWESWTHHLLPNSYANSSVGLCQTSLLPPHSIRHNRSDFPFQSHAPVARKQKRYPPLPGEGAAPYVLCKDCNQLLKVPADLSPTSENVQKLRCGFCGKVSRFSIHDQAKSQSSNVSLATNSIGQATNIPHLVQPSTLYKVYPETSTNPLSPNGRSFLSDNHGRWAPISKGTQMVGQQASYGITNLASTLLPPFERVEKKQVLHQAKASARTITVTEKFDHMCHAGPVTGAMEGQELSQSQMRYRDGDSFLSSSGMRSEYYLSSLPSITGGSIPPGNASGCQAKDNQNGEPYSRERAVYGGSEASSGLYSSSTMDEQDRSGSEALAISNNHCRKLSSEIITNFSHMRFQGSLPECHGECSGDDLLGRDQFALTLESKPQQLMELDLSRGTSESCAAQRSRWSAAPGSPLSEHSHEPPGLFPELNQRQLHQDFGNGVRSAPWSPAPGSPLYDHLLHDASSDLDEKFHQKEQDVERVHVNRGRRSLAGLLKRSLKDFGKGSQGNDSRPKVMVNGQVIQVAALKKAERQAGSIHPGSYWYDYQAGFWGVMGGQCLGIIPPFIEEFDYPIAKDCSGGRTGVLVNGRELHRKDLEVLSRRGLPITPGKAYTVDITGRVVDDASGQQLRSLGKLAPTLEKKGCGFGMSQPSAVQLGSAHSNI